MVIGEEAAEGGGRMKIARGDMTKRRIQVGQIWSVEQSEHAETRDWTWCFKVLAGARFGGEQYWLCAKTEQDPPYPLLDTRGEGAPAAHWFDANGVYIQNVPLFPFDWRFVEKVLP